MSAGQAQRSRPASSAAPQAAPLQVPSSVRCFAVLAVVKLSLLIFGFGRTRAWILRVTRGRPEGVTGRRRYVKVTAERVARAAAVFPGRALCLEQSLTLFVLLRSVGVEAALRLGIQAYPFAAHAWVEHDGEPVNEDVEDLSRLAALSTVPGAPE